MVTVIHHVDTGEFDADGNAVYNDVPENIEGVLVAPGTLEDVPGDLRERGVYVNYSLYLPKSWTGKTDDISAVTVRGNGPFKTVGYPDRYENDLCPTKWNLVIQVGGSNG
jgi:hypothetical protein